MGVGRIAILIAMTALIELATWLKVHGGVNRQDGSGKEVFHIAWYEPAYF